MREPAGPVVQSLAVMTTMVVIMAALWTDVATSSFGLNSVHGYSVVAPASSGPSSRMPGKVLLSPGATKVVTPGRRRTSSALGAGSAEGSTPSSPGAPSPTPTPSLTLYGHPGTRSPLVNWAAHELGVGDLLAKGDLRENPHPFGKLPCLTDDGGETVVFESGAILEYLQDRYGGGGGGGGGEDGKDADGAASVPLSWSDRAAVTSWIVWANASLDPVCFIETPQGRVVDTGFRNGHPRLDQLDELLATRRFLVGGNSGDGEGGGGGGGRFTLADVAVASYLLYVPQFFPNDVKMDGWPHLARYMRECASRDQYGRAFGRDVQSSLVKFLDPYVSKTTKKGEVA